MLINGQHIRFSITFNAPPLSYIYKSFTVTDKILDGLSFNDTDSFVKINDIIVPGYYFLYDENNNIKCFINNITGNDSNIIEVILDTVIKDKTKLINGSFSNTAFMYVNDDEHLLNQSNECSVQLIMPSQNELIIAPESQHIYTSFSDNKNILCNFKFIGISTENADSYIIQATIIDGYTFDENSTTITVSDSDELITTLVLNSYTPSVVFAYNEETKILLITILNSTEINNKLVNICLAMKPISAPLYNEVNNLILSLYYNNTQSKVIDQKTSLITLTKPITLIKSCDKYEKKLDTTTMIYYTLSFIVPENTKSLYYVSFTISDTLDKCLAFDLSHSTVLSDNHKIESVIIYPKDKSTGTIDITFRNYGELSGKKISVKIACYIYDLSLTPQNNIIYNDAVLTPNSNILLSSTSNKISIILKKYEEISSRNKIISSIATIEKSNSLILSEQAQLILKADGISIDENDKNEIRNSVNRIVNASSMLEHIMYQCLDEVEY